jgi:ABC-type nitrate/sulfonate/bicarbonate transport system permease component
MNFKAGLWRSLSLLGFVLVWHVAAQFTDNETLPSPLAVLINLQHHILEGQLLFHLGITLLRVFVSFAVAFSIGSAMGILMGRSKRFDTALDGVVILFLNIPALVTIILCYVWFGLTELAAIAAVVINKVPTVIVTIREGARAIDEQLLEVADVFRISRTRKLIKVFLPQLYPYFMASARSGLSLIWKIVLVVELLGRSNGVGFQLGTFFQFFDITSILAYTIAFAVVVMVIEAVFMRPLETYISRWRI